MRKPVSALITLAAITLASDVLARDQLMKVKGGHQLGETAEQFFAEGHEKDALTACATANFKGLDKPSKGGLKKYCADLTHARQQAISGKRTEYEGDGDPSEMRTDTFTFDGDHLVKVELVYSAPTAETNYRGRTFEQIFAGMQQAYGPPASEHTEPVHNTYGVQYLAHRELWESAQAVILITEQNVGQPWSGGSTTLATFTRAEYDRTVNAGAPKIPNPLQ